MWSTTVDDIISAFDSAGDDSAALKKMYHIYQDRPSSCRTGALDFINDYKFVLPIERMSRLWKASHKDVYRCLIDESNPWQPSSGAHHAVDLVLLFGGFDLSFSPGALETGKSMRKAWIKFINNEAPGAADSDSRLAFGPYGTCRAIDDLEARSRRRVAQVEKLDTMDGAVLDKVLGALAGGKISLLN